MKNRKFREIVQADIGRSVFQAFGCAWLTTDFIGRIARADVGKRVYLDRGVLSVENDAQFRSRLDARAVVRTCSCYDIEHGGIGRDLIEYQVVGASNVGTIVCNLYEFGFYIEPGTIFRFPLRWTTNSRIEILNGRTRGGDRGDDADDDNSNRSAFVDWVDGVPHTVQSGRE